MARLFFVHARCVRENRALEWFPFTKCLVSGFSEIMQIEKALATIFVTKALCILPVLRSFSGSVSRGQQRSS